MNFFNLYSKDLSSKLNICADEVGPILEFTIQSLMRNLKQNFILKSINKRTEIRYLHERNY